MKKFILLKLTSILAYNPTPSKYHIQTITNPLADRFFSKLLVNVMGVFLAEENFVFSLIVTSLCIITLSAGW